MRRWNSAVRHSQRIRLLKEGPLNNGCPVSAVLSDEGAKAITCCTVSRVSEPPAPFGRMALWARWLRLSVKLRRLLAMSCVVFRFITPSASVRGMNWNRVGCRHLACGHEYHIVLLRRSTPPGFELQNDGRSPDLRVLASLSLPGISQWPVQGCSPLTVAGAVTDLALDSSPHRIPYSSQGERVTAGNHPRQSLLTLGLCQ
jgi:hypothetical protein